MRGDRPANGRLGDAVKDEQYEGGWYYFARINDSNWFSHGPYADRAQTLKWMFRDQLNGIQVGHAMQETPTNSVIRCLRELNKQERT